MEPGLKRTTIAHIAAGLGFLCGVIGLLTAITNTQTLLAPHGWSNGSVLFLLVALFILVDGAVSFEKSRTIEPPKH
jgi:hypothetical protein